MLSKSKHKLVVSLVHKKQRDKQGLFIAEGEKLVSELISTYTVKTIFYTENFAEEKLPDNTECILISEKEMKQISQLQSITPILALFSKPANFEIKDEITSGLSIVLDGVQDPGNMGTIIRLANWFDIKNIICSKTCVDWFNPKVVQATMGALGRSNLCITDLESFLKNTKLPIYGTFMEGDNLYSLKLPKNAIIVLGSEGQGISKELYPHINQKITIPPFGDTPVESLNVAMATGIICSEFKRRSLK